MEKAWYEEPWVGELAGAIFAEPEPSPFAGYQLPPVKTGLGLKAEYGDWPLVITIISIVALILLFLFLRR